MVRAKPTEFDKYRSEPEHTDDMCANCGNSEATQTMEAEGMEFDLCSDCYFNEPEFFRAIEAEENDGSNLDYNHDHVRDFTQDEDYIF